MGSLPPTGIYRIVEKMRRCNTCTQAHSHSHSHTVTQPYRHSLTGTQPHRHSLTATQAPTHMNIDTQTGTYTVNQFKSPLLTGTQEEFQGHSHLKCKYTHAYSYATVWEGIIISYLSGVSL